MTNEHKLGICAWVLPGEEIAAFDLAASFGLDGVVIDYGGVGEEPPLMSKTHRDSYNKVTQANGLEIPTIALNLFCEKGMIHKGNEGFAREVFERAVEIAATMGIRGIQVPSFYDNRPRTEDEIHQTIEMLRYGCELAEKDGLTIGTENVFEPPLLKRVFEEVGSPCLTNLFDTANPYKMAGQDSHRIAEAAVGYTGELHFKEFFENGSYDVCLGQGDTGFDKTLGVLVQHSFSGWIQLESPYNLMADYAPVLLKDIGLARGIKWPS